MLRHLFIFEKINRYRRVYKNWISVMWNILFNKKELTATLKNGDRLKLTPWAAWRLSVLANELGYEELLKVLQDESISYKNRKIILHGIREGNFDFMEIYMKEVYKYLDVSGQTVIDIGANIADSSIYFILNGAKNVIGLEPHPQLFRFAALNVKENKMEDKIILLNAGYGEDSVLLVSAGKADTRFYLEPAKRGIKIKKYSLRTLVNEFGLERAVLKMDCEGCEYNLLQESCDVLRRFKQLQIEFHYGHKNIFKKLSGCGFKVDISVIGKADQKIRELKQMALKNNDNTFGYMYAELY